MYESFFGLRERPFDLTPDPRYLLLTPTHREALANLEYGMAARKGLTLLIGEAGTGKTTLVRRAFARDGDRTRGACVYLNNPTLTRREFYEFLAGEFALSPDAVESKARFLAEIDGELRRRDSIGETPVLVIDEAQSLPDDLLEEVRLLANIETDTTKLLPLVLTGQPELATRLNQPAFRQLKQRVALRCQLAALTLPETAAYIAARVRMAGGDPATLLSRDAVVAVYEHAHGIPRSISVLCDNALLTAFAAGERPIGEKTVHAVARDFDLLPIARPAAMAAASPRATVRPSSQARRRAGAVWPRLVNFVTLRQQEQV